MTTPDLKALSDAATQGKWEWAHFGSVKSLRSAGNTLAHFFIGKEKNAKEDTAYIVALINMHRAGQLFTAADVEAAVRKEREACAMIADSIMVDMMNSALTGLPEQARLRESMANTAEKIRIQIRARKTQEGET
tara:strand:- start:25327 stop:25728 length:402 start_codon:yes stop_codon:yes gene_type:complete